MDDVLKLGASPDAGGMDARYQGADIGIVEKPGVSAVAATRVAVRYLNLTI